MRIKLSFEVFQACATLPGGLTSLSLDDERLTAIGQSIFRLHSSKNTIPGRLNDERIIAVEHVDMAVNFDTAQSAYSKSW